MDKITHLNAFNEATKTQLQEICQPPLREQLTMLRVQFKEDFRKWTTEITLTNQMRTSSLAHGFFRFLFIFFQTNLSIAPILLQYSHKVNTGQQHDTDYWW
jgi:hypothetical protein